VSEDLIPNYKRFHVSGLNASVASTFETLWPQSSVYSYQTVAERLSISSTSASDTYGGAGARTLNIEGLDANYRLQNENIKMAGQTPVYTKLNYLRIFRMVVKTGLAVNIGTIYAGTGAVVAGVPQNVFNMIEPLYNTSFCGIWTVPAGYTLYVTDEYASEVAAKDTHIALVVKPFGEVRQIERIHIIESTSYAHKYTVPMPVAEKTDIELMAKSAGGSGIVMAAITVKHKMADDKRFEDMIEQVKQHEKRINGLDIKQAGSHILLKSVKEDTTEIKKRLDDLPCLEHHNGILTMKTRLSLKRRIVSVVLGSGGVAGVILIGLKLVGVI